MIVAWIALGISLVALFKSPANKKTTIYEINDKKVSKEEFESLASEMKKTFKEMVDKMNDFWKD